ncbi:MAG: CapA family protein [Tannerellaceae bacterium]
MLVSVHFGDEYSHTPSSRQRDIVKLLINFGADIVIGHHPHVLQPIEWIDNALVIYSLGNYTSGQIGENKRVGVMVGMEIVEIKNNSTYRFNTILL